MFGEHMKKIVFSFFAILTILSQPILTYEDDHYDYARYGRKNLRGYRLNFARLSNRDLAGCDFYHANLNCAKLIGTDLTLSSAEGIFFIYAILVNAKLFKIEARGAHFRNAILSGADLSDGNFKSADFEGALFCGCKYDDVVIEPAMLDGADFEGADFKDAMLTLEQKKYLREHGAINVPADGEFEDASSYQAYQLPNFFSSLGETFITFPKEFGKFIINILSCGMLCKNICD
jgi:hypothetical protein